MFVTFLIFKSGSVKKRSILKSGEFVFSADKQLCQGIEFKKDMKRYRVTENERILITLFLFHDDKLT